MELSSRYIIYNKKKIYRCRQPCCNITKNEHEIKPDHANEKYWNIIREDIIEMYDEQYQKEIQLGLALAKYHYYTGPNDWIPRYLDDAEDFVYNWVEWILENEEDWQDEISHLLKEYSDNLIPDAFHLFHDFTD